MLLLGGLVSLAIIGGCAKDEPAAQADATAAAADACCPPAGTDGVAQAGHADHATAADEHADHEGHEGHEEEDAHAGHAHAAGGSTDLDRPVAELFAASCEHAVKTHACDECRYEVGVAKAPADLFTGGLLHKTAPEHEAVRVPLALTGQVAFDERHVAHLSPPAEGIVRRVRVAVGDRVRRGDTLVEIDSGAAAEAAGELRAARAWLGNVEQAHRRIAALREQGIAPEKELATAVQELEGARIRLATAQAQAARLGLATTADAGVDGTLRLRASVDGTVLFLHAVAGEPAHPEEVMAIVGDVAEVRVWADLYERDLAQLPPAPLPAEVSVRAWPGVVFPGTVDLVGPSLDEASRTVKLRVAVPNPDGRLLSGMFATVNVMLPGDSQALVLPRDAVLEDEGRSFVFTHHVDDYYVRRPVTTGRVWGERIEITGGLRGDETIVAEGAFLLKSDVLRSKMGAGCAD